MWFPIHQELHGRNANGSARPCVTWTVILCCALAFGVTRGHENGPAEAPLDLSSPTAHAAYADVLAAESRARKGEAIAWARQAGHSVHAENGNRISELMALWEGRPVFYATANLDAATVIATDRVRDMAPWNLDGEGLAVGVWDSAGVLASHQEFEGLNGTSRVKIRDSFSTSAHATHVAATIGATGIDPLAKGMAPRVRIESYNWNDDTAQMFVLAASAPGQPGKIYVSNHSYGVMAGWEYFATEDLTGHAGWHWLGTWAGADSWEEWFGQYTGLACNWDNVAYLHPYYLAFAAAGNDRNDTPVVGETAYYWLGSGWKAITYDPDTCPGGDGEVNGGYGTVSGPSVAKNIMTVGAVVDAMAEETRSLAHAAMTDFSSWGPTDDGRVKPDIVANGTSVYSATDEDDNAYDTYNGTSMASPTACGSAVLLVQHYGQLFPGQAMRSSTLKGLIIHTADDLGRPGPDSAYGWGLMNTEAAAELIARSHGDPIGEIMTEGLLDNDGNSVHSYYFHSDGGAPIRITLCWTDYYAQTTKLHDDRTPLLVHDLDLRLIGPDGATTYFPYMLDPVHPDAPASTGDNVVDNVEQIYLPTSGEAGIYEVQVSFKGRLSHTRQHYSLISNAPLSDRRSPRAMDATVFVSLNQATTLTLETAQDNSSTPVGAIAFTIASLPEHGQLELLDGTLITDPGTLLGYSSQLVYRPDSGFTGTDRLTFYADDGREPPLGGPSNTATITLQTRDMVTTAYQISASRDDAYTLVLGGYQTYFSETLYVGQHCSALRFRDVDIPRGHEIVEARLKIRLWHDSELNALIDAEATGNPLDFSLSNPRINDRPRTAAAVEWDCIGAESSWTWELSPNIATVVQEVIDRADWSAGNALALFLSPNADRFRGLEFSAFDGKNSENAAILEITHAPAPDTGPVIPAGPGLVRPVAEDSEVYVSAGMPATVVLPATDDGLPAELTYTIESLPEHGTLISQSVALTEPGTLSDMAGAVVYIPDIGFTGDDSFTFYADDAGTAPQGGLSNTATITLKVRTLVTHQFEIVAASDDAHGVGSSQIVSSEMLAAGRYTSAMRFRNVTVPQGSEIVAARLLLCMGETSIDQKFESLISGEANDTTSDFADGNPHVANRPQTVASIPWVWQVGETYADRAYHSSPDIAPVIQEIVDRPGWSHGNALTVLFSGIEQSGPNVEFYACNENRSDRGAVLEITYAPDPDVEPLTPLPSEGAPPTAEDVSVETPINTPVTITLVGVDEGLPHPPGALTYTIASLPSHGTLAHPDGAPITQPTALPGYGNEVVYQPDTGFQGQDSFTYQVDDGGDAPEGGTSAPALVMIGVDHDPTSGPVDPISRWPFDEGAGSVAHDAIGDRHGVVHGALWTTGPVGSALWFDGSDDYVELPENAPIWLPENDFTTTVWVRFDREGELEQILDLNYAGSSRYYRALGYGIQKRWEQDRVLFTVMTESMSPNDDLWTETSFAKDRWYHITAVRRGDSQEIYVNGQLDNSRQCAASPVDFIGDYDDDKVNLGRLSREGGQGSYFGGSLDDVMIFGEALSGPQVLAIYQEGTGVVTTEGNPPTAEDVEISTSLNMAVSITLAATDDGLPGPPGALTYTIATLPQHGVLRDHDGTPITQPTALPNRSNEVTYQPNAGFTGQDSFTFYADDGGIVPTGSVSNTAVVTIEVGSSASETITLELQVGRAEDDAFAAPMSPWNSPYEGHLYVGTSSSAVRFTEVDIPPKSKILSAHLEVYVSEPVRCLAEVILQAEASGNAANFLGSGRHICRLPCTEASVSWQWELSVFHGHTWDWGWRESPDIASVIQEVIDRPDWSAGHAIALIASNGDTACDDDVAFFAFDHSGVGQTRAAKLEITFQK